MSGDTSEEVLSLLGSGDEGRVLGVGWDSRDDTFTVTIHKDSWQQSRFN